MHKLIQDLYVYKWTVYIQILRALKKTEKNLESKLQKLFQLEFLSTINCYNYVRCWSIFSGFPLNTWADLILGSFGYLSCYHMEHRFLSYLDELPTYRWLDFSNRWRQDETDTSSSGRTTKTSLNVELLAFKLLYASPL